VLAAAVQKAILWSWFGIGDWPVAEFEPGALQWRSKITARPFDVNKST
jgi:hypothetical protein